MGLFLWLWPSFDFGRIRWVGVLPRVHGFYGLCLLSLPKDPIDHCRCRLVLYWLVMMYLQFLELVYPIWVSPEKLGQLLDQNYLPGYLWEETWDPEGILSSFPAVVTGCWE